MTGLISKPLPNREEIDHLIQSAVESGASEIKLRALASQGMAELFTAPEIQFVWQRTWRECSNTPELVLASRTGYYDKVIQLLRSGVNPNVAQGDGNTPLMAAAYTKSTAIAKLLLEAHADVNLASDNGVTPLILAARSGNLELIELLLQHGSIVNTRAKNGWTALMHAAQEGYAEILERLIQAGAAIDTVDPYGQTPLMVGAHSPSVLRILFRYPLELNSRDVDGETPLMRAAADDQSQGPGNFEAVSLLLERGADTNVQDNEGRTALMRACAYEDPGIVRLLLDHGAAVGTKDRQGQTALSIAISGRNQAVIEELRRTPDSG